jgi:Lar family restriction alleviation protein
MKSDNVCPFCGESVIVFLNVGKHITGGGRQAECDNCGARGPVYENDEQALIGWNEGISTVGGRYRVSN